VGLDQKRKMEGVLTLYAIEYRSKQQIERGLKYIEGGTKER